MTPSVQICWPFRFIVSHWKTTKKRGAKTRTQSRSNLKTWNSLQTQITPPSNYGTEGASSRKKLAYRSKNIIKRHPLNCVGLINLGRASWQRSQHKEVKTLAHHGDETAAPQEIRRCIALDHHRWHDNTWRSTALISRATCGRKLTDTRRMTATAGNRFWVAAKKSPKCRRFIAVSCFPPIFFLIIGSPNQCHGCCGRKVAQTTFSRTCSDSWCWREKSWKICNHNHIFLEQRKAGKPQTI